MTAEQLPKSCRSGHEWCFRRFPLDEERRAFYICHRSSLRLLRRRTLRLAVFLPAPQDFQMPGFASQRLLSQVRQAGRVFLLHLLLLLQCALLRLDHAVTSLLALRAARR